MKKVQKLALLLLSLLAVQTMHADDFDLYLIGLEGNSYTSLDFANLQSLSFTQTREVNGDNATVYVNRMSANYSDGTSKVYDLANFSAIQFEDVAVGIDGLPSSDLAFQTFVVRGGQIVSNCVGALTISQLDGRSVYERSVSVGERVNVPSLSKGIYIVNVGGQSAKILVK